MSSVVDQLIPPESLNFVGAGGFKETGNEFKGHFVKLGGLRPEHRVLDVGCGIGRMAVPLTQYLSAKGSYEGFDPVKMGIDWCQAKITPLYPNFRFQTVDVYNSCYKQDATTLNDVFFNTKTNAARTAAKLRFPYDSSSFDFVFLTSVFTHMMPSEVENYVAEIARVLKKGGRCFATFFILNAESEKCIAEGRSSLAFAFKHDRYRLQEEERPEHAIAYDEAYAKSFFTKCSMKVDEPLSYGQWCGRAKYVSYQDILIATKVS